MRIHPSPCSCAERRLRITAQSRRQHQAVRGSILQALAMSYTGGTFGTAAAPFAGVGVSSNSTSLVTLNSAIVANRVNLFQGGFINSNLITLGNGGASTTIVQIGSNGLTTPGGSFDLSPVHSQGSGGQIILYVFETAPRVTGVEINPTRVLTSMTVDNP